MRRLCLILLLVPALAGAETITLKFSSASERIVDVVEAPTAKLSQTTTTEREVRVEASGDMWVRVVDLTSGNMAARKAAELKGAWAVQPADYKRIGEVRVRVEQGDAPLEVGSVAVGSVTELLMAGSKGEVAFFGVPIGKVSVSVSYPDGESTKTSTMGFDVPAQRDLSVPKLVMTVAGRATAMPEPAPADPNRLPPPKDAPAPTGILGNIIAMLFAAAAALAVLFFGLKWIYGNQDKAKDALTKLGVQVPDPVSANDPAPPPVADPFPQPITPIVLDPAPPIAVTPVVLGGGTLSLVGAAGIFELSEGVHVIGREAGLTIALVGESTVSRRHAEIVRTGDSIIVRDVGSTNGTFVNGARLAGDHPLRSGDRVQFGSVAFEVKSS